MSIDLMDKEDEVVSYKLSDSKKEPDIFADN